MQVIQERFTARTLIKWRPSELRDLTEWCAWAKVDRALLIRGAAMAVVRDPLKALKFLDLPKDVVEGITQTTLPLVEAQPKKRGRRGRTP